MNPELPPGFQSLDDYMAEVMADPVRAKLIEEARPTVLRMLNHALCDQIAALRADAVPREPTEAMKHAGYVAQLDSSYEYDELCAEIWRAMYDAAMKP